MNNSSGIHVRAFHMKSSSHIEVTKMHLKIPYLKLLPRLAQANELTLWWPRNYEACVVQNLGNMWLNLFYCHGRCCAFAMVSCDMLTFLWGASPCLYLLSGKTSYRQISQSLKAARLQVIMSVSLWNLTGISSAAAEVPVKFQNYWKTLKSRSESRGFETSQDLAVRHPSTSWIEALVQQ